MNPFSTGEGTPLTKGSKQFTKLQLQILLAFLKAGYYPNLRQRHQLAKFMNVKEKRIVNWFNRKHFEQKSAALTYKRK